MSHVVTAASLLDSLGIPGQAGSLPTGADLGIVLPGQPSGFTYSSDDLRVLFEQRRVVRPVISSGQSATIPMRTLNSELTCPVCLGIIQSCTAVMECLHRFCSSCIEKSIRLGKKECPSCRVSVPSRRNLRKDAAFDAVIKAIYPDITKAEASHETYIQEVIKSYNVRSFGEIATKGARQQKDQAKRSNKRPASPPPSGALSHSAQQPLSKRPRNPLKPEPISFSLVQHPTLSQSAEFGPIFQLHNKFVRTSRYITVLLLKKWLQLKLITDKERAAKKQSAITAAPAVPTEEKKEESTEADASAPATAAGADAKMEDAAPAAAAAAAEESASPSPLGTTVHPSVRFVLYVRAYDTSLVNGGTDAGAPIELSESETFVPLASDLTLDYIEEHMWNSEGAANTRASDQLNAALQALPAGGDPAPLFKVDFAKSFAKCSSHRKAKAPCPEDCADRVAAWTEYLVRETEKVKQWREASVAAAAAAQASAVAAATAALSASSDPNAAAVAAVAASPQATPVFTPAPLKKRRLVLYYSVVGADGQLLLDAPSIAPEIMRQFLIPDPTPGPEDETSEGATPAPAAAAAAPQQAAEQPDAPVPMQIDGAEDATPATAAL